MTLATEAFYFVNDSFLMTIGYLNRLRKAVACIEIMG